MQPGRQASAHPLLKCLLLQEERALSMLTAGMQAELAAREAAGELDAEGSGAGDEAPAEGQPAEAPGM